MRAFVFAALFMAGSGVRGEISLRACDPDDATVRTLDQWARHYNDATLDFDARMAPLWKAIASEPGNVFLHHAYQRVFLNYIESVRIGAAESAYQELLAAHSDNLALRYAFARFLWGRRTAEAKQMLEQVIAADPAFPWPHLAMARIHQNKKFEDEGKQRDHVGRFFALCPAPLASEAYDSVSLMPLAFRQQVAVALRSRLRETGSVRALGPLWQIEFQDPARDKGALRVAVAADLVRLRAASAESLPLLRGALEGYRLLDDREGARWARERIAAVEPRSFLACDIAIERWYADRTRPTMESSRERVLGYYGELLEASSQWIRMCPLYEAAWSSRFRALRELPDAPAAQVLEAGDGMLRASEANSSNWFVAPSILVGTVFAERGVGQERITALIERNRRDTAARLAADTQLDWFPAGWKAENEVEAGESFVQARLLAIRKYVREKKPVEAARELAEAETLVAGAAGDAAFWTMMPPLLSAYLELGEVAKAEAGLGKLREWLTRHPLGAKASRVELVEHRGRESIVWEYAGRLATRPEERATAYRKVLAMRSKWETLAQRLAMIDEAGSRWETLGGEMAGKWDTIDRRLDGLTLTDMTGRKWTEESLRGKVTLINIWATWCAPCVAELPYVQRIANAVKERRDVQVITLNVDENPGLIAPFLREHGLEVLTVIPAQEYVERVLHVNGFPRTWIVDRDGVARREQAGFTGEPEKWVARVVEVLR